MSDIIKIKQGLNIKLKGEAEKIFKKADKSETYAVKPTDFKELTPKLSVKQGDKVKAGTALFYDKNNPEIVFSSPVSGTVVDIVRGDRRKLLEVVVKADENITYESFLQADPLDLTRDEIIRNLLISGTWPVIKQRPYGIIAKPEDMPKSIFISAFDTSPLAPDYDFVVMGCELIFQTGINALSKLTQGEVHLSIDSSYPASSVFTKSKNIIIHKFKGPHPAGNVGTQIHHIDPINKGEIVWVVGPQDVIAIGKLFQKGIYDATRVVALTGSEVLKPFYFKLIRGASISNLVINNVTNKKLRYISGNVLTGSTIKQNGYIGFYDSQVTVIPEGCYYEFLGWALPGFNKFSTSRTFFSWLTPGREYRMDTNLKGGKRAYVMTGQYEKVFPFNIYPVQLIKAILFRDIDLMENLGIYEVVEEDFALCEFVCTSKTEVQTIVQKGIELMIKEMN